MQHQSKYKTRIGGFFTLLMVSLCLLLFFNFGSDMMYHQNPTVIFSEIFSKNPERIYYSRNNYFFMFGIEAPDTYAHFIDETIYTVNVVSEKISKTSNDSFNINVPIERCSETHLPDEPTMNDYFMKASGSPIIDLYCIKDIENYYLEGSFDTDVYTFIEISITQCNNKTDPSAPICKSQEEINQKLSGFFAFYTMDYLIDPTNFNKPGQPVGKDYFSPISIGMTRNNNRYIAPSKVNSDDGFLFTAKNNYIYPSYKEDKETLLIDTSNQGFIMDFVLRDHHDEMIYERRYKKIQNVLAEIGGLIQILYLIFLAITYPFISKLYFEKIINSIFNFENSHFNKTNIRKVASKRLDDYSKTIFSLKDDHKYSPSILNSNYISDMSSLRFKNIEKKNFDHKNNEDLIKYLIKIQNQPPLKTTYWEFIKKMLCPPSSNEVNENNNQNDIKYKRLKKGKKSIMGKLDISYILKKFYEIDKLKMLLLNDNQYHLFEYSSKPIILQNSEIDLGNSKNTKFISYETDVIGKAKKMLTAYSNIIKQNELSAMDKKLIDNLDENIKSMLNVIIIFFNCLKLFFSDQKWRIRYEIRNTYKK